MGVLFVVRFGSVLSLICWLCAVLMLCLLCVLCVVGVLDVVGEMNVMWVLVGVVDLCLPCLRDGARLTGRGAVGHSEQGGKKRCAGVWSEGTGGGWG